MLFIEKIDLEIGLSLNIEKMSSETLQIIEPGRIGPYTIRGTVGEGAFSVVKLVYHNPTREFCACKIVPKSRINTPGLQQRFELEIRINQQLHHPGIVQIFDLLKDENNYYIVMEFCPNGELFQFIVDRQRLSEPDAQPIFRQILETLEYIHSMGVSHRDMKPENLLIDQVGHLKISDFGLSRFLNNQGLVDTPCGSPCYASPECISGKSYDGVTTDVWSSGVILYAMLTGQLPWTKRNQTQLFQQIKKGEYSIPDYLSPECQDFIRKLMTVDHKQRITIQEAYRHPWMSKTPPILPNLPVPKSGVSLRMVDKFFGYVFSMINLPRSALVRNTSMNSLSFNQALNECVRDNGLKMKKRKRKVQTSHPDASEEVGPLNKSPTQHQTNPSSSRGKRISQRSVPLDPQIQQPRINPPIKKTKKTAATSLKALPTRPKPPEESVSLNKPTASSIAPSKMPRVTNSRPTATRAGRHSRAIVTKPHPTKSVL